MFRDLPSRVEDRLSDDVATRRRRKLRRFSPMMFEEIMHMRGQKAEPINILIFASLIRDDVPWLYEIAMEAYRALTSGTLKAVEQIRHSLKQVRDLPMRSPIFEELGMMGSKQMHMIMMEGPRMLEKMVLRCIKEKKSR